MGKSKHQWIPAGERLPVKDRFVLCLHNGTWDKLTYHVLRYSKHDHWVDVNDYIFEPYSRNCGTITHWMPLPKPPEEEP